MFTASDSSPCARNFAIRSLVPGRTAIKPPSSMRKCTSPFAPVAIDSPSNMGSSVTGRRTVMARSKKRTSPSTSSTLPARTGVACPPAVCANAGDRKAHPASRSPK